MKLLTFDTSLDNLYVTISENGNIIQSETIANTKERYNSASLIPTIINILKTHKLTMQNIDALAVNIGPGSFTGIRASITVARVAAQQLDIPVVGIPSLQIISLINNTDKNSIVLSDARKNKYYVAVYNSNGEVIETPTSLDKDLAIEKAINNDYIAIADNKVTSVLEEKGINATNFQAEGQNFGEYLAKLAYKELKDKSNEHKWYNLKPLYIQPPSITMPKKK